MLGGRSVKHRSSQSNTSHYNGIPSLPSRPKPKSSSFEKTSEKKLNNFASRLATQRNKHRIGLKNRTDKIGKKKKEKRAKLRKRVPQQFTIPFTRMPLGYLVFLANGPRYRTHNTKAPNGQREPTRKVPRAVAAAYRFRLIF